VAEVSTVCDAEAVVGSHCSAGYIRESVPVACGQPHKSQRKGAPRSPTARLGRHSPAMLPTGDGAWSRHQPAPKVAVPADIHGGDAVAENYPSGLSDALAVRSLSNDLGLALHVCHFPPGTSKWNKIEHRLFCFITKNWRGRPLTSYEVIVNLIGSTTTTSGLTVRAALDTSDDETGIEVSDEQLARVKLTLAKFHGEWNYTIRPGK
jgi:hypothetical protein